MIQTFTIRCHLPGLNEIIKAAKSRKGNWSRYAELKEVYESIIRVEAKRAKLRPVVGRVRILLHWTEPNARRDFGNIRAGEKFISDALVSMGILRTDGQTQVVGFRDTFSVEKGLPSVRVTLEEVEA